MATKPPSNTRAVTRTGSGSIFDDRPIVLDGFTLVGRSVVINGRPKIQAWQQAMAFASAAHEASPYWVGDLLAYASDREDWKEKFDQAITVTGLARQTLHNLTTVSRKVQEPERRISPSLSHSKEVMSLPSADQRRFLTRARDEGLTSSELARTVRAESRRKVIDGQAILEGMYRVILSDNPWVYNNRQASGSGAADHYGGMSIEAQCKLPIAAHALPNSILFMWTTAPLILANPGPREVGEAWGFTYKTQIVWDKVVHNKGHYTGANHEILTIWTRGSCTPDVPVDLPDSVQVVQRTGEHSEKPEDFRRLIEKHWTSGPYLELFARERHEGWTCFGNDAKLWTAE